MSAHPGARPRRVDPALVGRDGAAGRHGDRERRAELDRVQGGHAGDVDHREIDRRDQNNLQIRIEKAEQVILREQPGVH